MDADGKNITQLTEQPLRRLESSRGRPTANASHSSSNRDGGFGISMSYILNSTVVGDQTRFHANGSVSPSGTDEPQRWNLEDEWPASLRQTNNAGRSLQNVGV